MNVVQQALRWGLWESADPDPEQQLIRDLTHEFCRIVRHGLDELRRPSGGEVALGRYLNRIRVFISHSRHDDGGECVARTIHDWIHSHSSLDSFLDVHDIPAGLSFGDVLLHEIEAGVLLAVHTDSYSSRKWCRREIIEAKRRLVPMVVVDCVQDIDPRVMPYLGNVPVIRMDPDRKDQIGVAIGRLLDEVFRSWLWYCRVGPYIGCAPGVLFTPRHPELIALAAMASSGGDSVSEIVYPEPMLDADEERLFKAIAPRARLQTLADWLENPR